jgi:dienelactone hydrolase
MVSARIAFPIAIACLLAASAYPQDPVAAARALIPPGTKYSDALLDSAAQETQAALTRIQRATTKEDVERASPTLRKRLENSLGLQRLPAPELKPVVTGSLDRDGYRIEKIVFQTLPGLAVPAHLYVPAGLHDRAPAVLVYPGRTWKTEGKSHRDAQIFSANVARMGFVVFVFDPIGQGERYASDEDYRITQALLVGLSQPGIAEYEIRCALEYLSSRSEVDPHKIGMTGADGGGFMTWITAALDDRIAAVAIADDTEDFGDIIHRMRQTDWDKAEDQRELIPGILQYANNHELLAMFAPHPLLIMTNSEQFGQNSSARSIFDYGADIYGRFGANAKARLFVDSDDGPGYQRQKRQAAYKFFLTALMGQQDPQPLDEKPGEVFLPPDSTDLRCLPPGSASPALPVVMAEVRNIASKLPEAGTNIRIQDLVLPWPPRVRYGWGINGVGVQRFVFETQRGGYSMPWLHMRKYDGDRGMIIALDDRGKEVLVNDPFILEAQKRGYSVAAVDMRGTGELTGHSGWLFAVNLLLGDNVVWKEALDTLTLLDEWHDFVVSHVAGIYANGPIAGMAASYATSMRPGPAPEFVILRNGLLTFRELLDHEVPDWAILPGALSSVDLMHPFYDASTNDIHSWIVDPLAKMPVPPKMRVATLEELLLSEW